MQDSGVLNPPATDLGERNAVMGSAGVGRHHVSDFAGPLSIKFMVRGSGVWRSDAGVHHVEEGYFLVLNRGQTYSLDIDSRLPRESFCPFFRHGFVEDIRHTLCSSAGARLDDPGCHGPAPAFQSNLQPHDRTLVPALLALRSLVYDKSVDAGDLDDAFIRLGEALLWHAERELPVQMARVQASRAATRAECHRRLARGLDYLHANAHRPLTLDELATQACFSPYHFHRQFKAVHRMTPHQYLSRLRLARAARLLRDSDLPVTRIALEVGFDNAAAFTRRFARAYGRPPGQYRASGPGPH